MYFLQGSTKNIFHNLAHERNAHMAPSSGSLLSLGYHRADPAGHMSCPTGMTKPIRVHFEWLLVELLEVEETDVVWVTEVLVQVEVQVLLLVMDVLVPVEPQRVSPVSMFFTPAGCGRLLGGDAPRLRNLLMLKVTSC